MDIRQLLQHPVDYFLERVKFNGNFKRKCYQRGNRFVEMEANAGGLKEVDISRVEVLNADVLKGDLFFSDSNGDVYRVTKAPAIFGRAQRVILLESYQ